MQKLTLSGIKQSHKQAGGHFFDRGAMRFFDSRIERGVYHAPVEGVCFFVTSEQFHGSAGSMPREYTVRRFDLADPGDIETIGEFGAYKTLEDARFAAKRAARLYVTPAPA